MYLHVGASDEDVPQLERFQRTMAWYAAWRDGCERPAFTLPVSACSDDPFCTALDTISAECWLDDHGFTSPRLRWLVAYACRDDYGTTLGGTSVWAALFYFTARLQADGQTRPVITWPEGNGALVEFLRGQVAKAVHTNVLVCDVRPSSTGVDVVALDALDNTARGWHAKHVIFAAPQFIARRVLQPYREAPPAHIDAFEHSAWTVTNLHLRDRPQNRGFPRGTTCCTTAHRLGTWWPRINKTATVARPSSRTITP